MLVTLKVGFNVSVVAIFGAPVAYIVAPYSWSGVYFGKFHYQAGLFKQVAGKALTSGDNSRSK